MEVTPLLSVIEPKVLRRLQRAWDVLTCEKGLIVPKTIEDHKKHIGKSPEINLKKATWYFSEKGRAGASEILDALCEIPQVKNFHTRDEVYQCFMRQYESMWNDATKKNLLDDLDEFLPKLSNSLRLRIHRLRLYERVSGVRLERIDCMAIGRIKLRQFDETLQSTFESLHKGDRTGFYGTRVLPFIKENFIGNLCFEGEYEVDSKKADELYREDCLFALSIIRLLVCLHAYEKIHFVRVPVRLWAESVQRDRPSLSINLDANLVTIGWGRVADSEGPLINPENLKVLRESWFWDDLCSIPGIPNRTEVEDLILTGVKWIGDAQDDADNSSSFVKYWTCLEGAFTADRKNVADNLAKSISSLLIYGGYRFYPVEEFGSLFSEVKTLYAIRSDIVHRGRSKKFTGKHLASSCKLAVYVIFSLLGLRSQGYTKRSQIQEQADRLYTISTRTTRPAT